jgi:hypothetical protein
MTHALRRPTRRHACIYEELLRILPKIPEFFPPELQVPTPCDDVPHYRETISGQREHAAGHQRLCLPPVQTVVETTLAFRAFCLQLLSDMEFDSCSWTDVAETIAAINVSELPQTKKELLARLSGHTVACETFTMLWDECFDPKLFWCAPDPASVNLRIVQQLHEYNDNVATFAPLPSNGLRATLPQLPLDPILSIFKTHPGAAVDAVNKYLADPYGRGNGRGLHLEMIYPEVYIQFHIDSGVKIASSANNGFDASKFRKTAQKCHFSCGGLSSVSFQLAKIGMSKNKADVQKRAILVEKKTGSRQVFSVQTLSAPGAAESKLRALMGRKVPKPVAKTLGLAIPTEWVMVPKEPVLKCLNWAPEEDNVRSDGELIPCTTYPRALRFFQSNAYLAMIDAMPRRYTVRHAEVPAEDATAAEKAAAAENFVTTTIRLP